MNIYILLNFKVIFLRKYVINSRKDRDVAPQIY